MNKIAIVVPCFNEEGSLQKMYETLSKEISKNKAFDFDIIFANDGSSDDTQAVISRIAKSDNRVHFVELAANAGHQAALRAGLTVAINHNAAIMLDADLQHPPSYIAEMLKTWEEGYKIVQMVRNDSAEQAGRLKYATSRLYYMLLRALSGIDLVYGSSDFRLVDSSILKQLSAVREPNLFLRGYFASLEVKTKFIKYAPDERFAGESKYNFKKMLALAKEGIVQFSVRPLYASIVLGLFTALAGVLYGVYLIVRHFQGGAHAVSGWSSIMVALLFLAGINFVLLGVIGLYLAQNIRIARGRPDFIVASSSLPALDAED